jgi:hypothetical protein
MSVLCFYKCSFYVDSLCLGMIVCRGHFEKMWASSMDEAADWRKKYDDENGKVLEILQRLTAVEQQLQNCTLDRKAAESEKGTLLEENADLQKEITRLKRGLE